MNDRFTSPTPFTREQLEAYALGGLSPEQQHAVEVLLEESPLHDEAVEGFRAVPEAAVVDLDRHRPGRSGGTSWIIGGGALLVIGALLWHTFQSPSVPIGPGSVAVQEDTVVPTSAPLIVLTSAEIATARDLPESLQIGHEPRSERPPLVTIDERQHDDGPVPEPMSTRSTQPRPATTDPRSQQPKNAPRPSRHCVFLHDLKVVHPDEVYSEKQPMFHGLGAQKPVAEEPWLGPDPSDTAAWKKVWASAPQPTIPYLDYMDHALGSFAKGDHKTAVEDLNALLEQLPDDVNGLFYSGLCYYNLGLFQRANDRFTKARDHRIDTFMEEAQWYHALCTEKLHGRASANYEFKRIADAGGFYAAKAKERLKP